MVDWCYSIRAKADAEEDEGGLDGQGWGVGGCDGAESVFVNVGRVLCHIDS